MACGGMLRMSPDLEPLNFLEDDLTLALRGVETISTTGVQYAQQGDVLNVAHGKYVLVSAIRGDVTGYRRSGGLVTSIDSNLYGVTGASAPQPESLSSSTAPITTLVSGGAPTVRGDVPSGEAEVVFDPQANAQYMASLGSGGYGQAYGALGAAGAAQYQQVTPDGGSVPVTAPPTYTPPQYTPPTYTPPPPTQGTTQSYEEWSQGQDTLEQLEVLNQGGFGWGGPLV